jgi:AcrR family transcriptional regulator
MAGSSQRAAPAQRRDHRTTPAQGEETRARLVETARELFAARGYAGVTMEQVCTRAEVTRGALYHHFAGKDDLFRTVCENVAETVTGQLIEAARSHAGAWPRLREGCHAFLAACSDQGVRQILLTDAPSVLGWARYRELDAGHGLGLLRAGIQAATDSGAIQASPVDLTAHMLAAALDEAAMVIGRATQPDAARQDAARIIDRIQAGIAGEHQPGSSSHATAQNAPPRSQQTGAAGKTPA